MVLLTAYSAPVVRLRDESAPGLVAAVGPTQLTVDVAVDTLETRAQLARPVRLFDDNRVAFVHHQRLGADVIRILSHELESDRRVADPADNGREIGRGAFQHRDAKRVHGGPGFPITGQRADQIEPFVILGGDLDHFIAEGAPAKQS